MEFYEQMEKNGQLKPGLRPDERRGWLYNRQTPEGQWEARYCPITILIQSVILLNCSIRIFFYRSIRDSVSALTCKEKKNFESQDDSLALVLIMLYFKLFIW